MLTGIQALDDWHHPLFSLADELANCADSSVPDIYRILLAVLEQVFAREQRLMEQARFPASKCHLEQHARVLAALHHLHPMVLAGDHGIARRAGAQLLPDWLKLHIATQDQALAAWVSCTRALMSGEASESCQGKPDAIADCPYCAWTTLPHSDRRSVSRIRYGRIDPPL